MHCGRTRTVHGFHPSAAPSCGRRRRASARMLYILDDTFGRNDVLFPRCSAYVYESAYGFDVHTNCHDIQAEAQREYGLTPDDVHDSFNLFMCTEVTLDGHATMTRQDTKPGDHVDLLALMDVLAVPNVCGADVMRTSNFSLKPIRLTVFYATEADLATAPEVADPAQPAHARRISAIRPSRPTARCAAIPSYAPEFPNVPIVVSDLPVSLSAEEAELLGRVKLPTSTATTTRRRCAISCSRGGKSGFSPRIPGRRQSASQRAGDLLRVECGGGGAEMEAGSASCNVAHDEAETRMDQDTPPSLHLGHAEGGAAPSHRGHARARDDDVARQAQQHHAALRRRRCDPGRLSVQLAAGFPRPLLCRHVRAADPAGFLRPRLRLSAKSGGAERHAMSRSSSTRRATPSAAFRSTR